MQPVPCTVNPGAPCYRESEEWIRWVYGKGYLHSLIPHIFIEPFDMCQVGLDSEENKTDCSCSHRAIITQMTA